MESSSSTPKTSHHFSRFSNLLILFLPGLFFLLFLSAIHILPRPEFLLTESEKFSRFSEEIFRNELAGNTLNMHYTIADPAAWKLEDLPVSIGDHSPRSIQNSFAVLENYKNAISKFEYSSLTPEQQRTYDVFLNHLETELAVSELYLYDEPLSPSLGIQAQLPILLAEYEFRVKGDIEDYLALLSQIPAYFDSLLSFEQEKAANGLFMSSDCALEVIKQCQDFIEHPETNYLLEIFNEKIDRIHNLTADEKTAFKARNESVLNGYVIPAYETLISGITDLKDTGVNEKGLYWLPNGQEYYEHLLKATTGDQRSAAEIEEHIKTQMIADYKSIQQLSENLTAAKSSVKNYDFSGTSKAASMLKELRKRIAVDFPPLPDVSCDIRYVHTSLQEHLSPAFYLTPAIDDYLNNVIYINPASDYSDLELYTTLAHEGYPGHLYQSVYFCHTNPDPLRSILDTGGYTEGWATYVEMYAHTLWDSDPKQAALQQKNRSFTLGLASLLDIGIHYHGYTLDDVTDFLAKLGFENSTAKSLYRTILQAPANYLQYYVGYLNFCSLRNEVQTLYKDQFSLKDFHDCILKAGPAPFELLRQYVLEDYQTLAVSKQS